MLAPTTWSATARLPTRRPRLPRRPPPPGRPRSKAQSALAGGPTLAPIAPAPVTATRANSSGVTVASDVGPVQAPAGPARTASRCTAAGARIPASAPMLDAACKAPATLAVSASAQHRPPPQPLQQQRQRRRRLQCNGCARPFKTIQRCLQTLVQSWGTACHPARPLQLSCARRALCTT